MDESGKYLYQFRTGERFFIGGFPPETKQNNGFRYSFFMTQFPDQGNYD
ncbi:hypothetical protein MKMG_00836 [Methanogenium sp. MK-MG]|nr:hypothetical protein MKMG_00836 [Methanogenium sp. MK-MG]